MQEQAILIEILKRMQGRYTSVNKIFTYTNDMVEALSRDDRVSAEILINMRQEEMDNADIYMSEIQEYMKVIPYELVSKVKSSVEGDNPGNEELFELKKIGEIGSNIKLALQKTIAIDKVMSKRIAGEDSYYQ